MGGLRYLAAFFRTVPVRLQSWLPEFLPLLFVGIIAGGFSATDWVGSPIRMATSDSPALHGAVPGYKPALQRYFRECTGHFLCLDHVHHHHYENLLVLRPSQPPKHKFLYLPWSYRRPSLPGASLGLLFRHLRLCLYILLFRDPLKAKNL